ncbi:MAG: oligosaccharide flippase family protein [Acidobacteria bacterium]|nr:oligosaccharide flippase family protein [Acidobacteriota bacterium]
MSRTLDTFPERTGWRGAVASLKIEDRHSRILSGSMVMLIGIAIVSAFNFGYNVAMARMLGPAEFGHASAAVTLLMLVSAITLAFQLVCAKFVARNESPGARASLVQSLLQRAWIVGLAMAALMALGSGGVSRYLRLPASSIVLVLCLGIAFYVPLGVKRGAMQGECAFPRLAGNFILEVVVKFGSALLLVGLGFGVMGAVAALTASVALAYFLPPSGHRFFGHREKCIPASFREGMQAMIFFIGQVIINNIDILLVKHFFAPEAAGMYAAVALVGRVLYFACWSVVSAMFPVSAGTRAEEHNASLLVVPLLLVVLLSVGFILLVTFVPGLIVHVVFGSGYHEAEPLLSLYAAATGLYSLSVVLMAYEMSRRIANTGWLQLFFSGAIVAGIELFHSTLRDVIVVQIVLMVVLLIAVSLPFFRYRTAPLTEAQ